MVQSIGTSAISIGERVDRITQLWNRLNTMQVVRVSRVVEARQFYEFVKMSRAARQVAGTPAKGWSVGEWTVWLQTADNAVTQRCRLLQELADFNGMSITQDLAMGIKAYCEEPFDVMRTAKAAADQLERQLRSDEWAVYQRMISLLA